MSIFKAWANKTQTLVQHTVEVCEESLTVLKELGVQKIYDQEFNITLMVVWSCLLHDIGKLEEGCQEYLTKIKGKKSLNVADAEAMRLKSFRGPFHNEISWCLKRKHFSLFGENEDEIVEYALLWHHPANWESDKKSLSEIRFQSSQSIIDAIGQETFESVAENAIEFVRVVIRELGQKNKVFREIFNNYGFERSFYSGDHQPFYRGNVTPENLPRVTKLNALKRLVLAALIESDRRVSNRTAGQSKVEPAGEFKNIVLTKPDIIDTRSLKQDDTAEIISKQQVTVLSSDPATGKTRTFLRFFAKGSRSKKNYVALPRRTQVNMLYHSVLSDIAEVYQNGEILSVEAFHSGGRQISHNAEGLSELNSDINILTFDRFLSPSFDSSKIEDYFSILCSRVVVDEFHEFVNNPSMIQPLKELMYCKLMLDNSGSILLMSGTEEPALCRFLGIEKYILERDCLEEVHQEKSEFRIQEESKFPSFLSKQLSDDTLISTNTIEEAQTAFIKDKSGNKVIIHGLFVEDTKSSLISGLAKKYGKYIHKSSEPVGNIYSARMLESSFDISMKNALITAGLPSGNCQILGRKNRFGGKAGGVVVFYIPDEERIKMLFSKNRMGHLKIALRWREYLLEQLAKPKKWTHRESMNNLYINFWKCEDNISVELNYITESVITSINEVLSKFYPKRTYEKGRKKPSEKNRYCNNLFRGASYLLSACKVDSTFKKSGQLRGKELLFVSKKWEILAYSSWTEHIKATRTVNLEDTFKFNKYKKRFGFSEDTPFLCSHYSEEVENNILRNFSERCDTENLYRYYHTVLGLISKNILDKSKNDIEENNGCK